MFDSHAASYRDYLKEHESAKGAFAVKLTRLAKERLELARGGAKLIDLLNASVKPAAGAGPAKARIEAIAALVKLNDEDPPDRLRTSLRRVARLLCDDFVKKEPFDDFVQVLNDKTYDTVKRKDVSIHPKNGDDELLGPDGEYSLKADQIDLLTVKDDTLGPFPSGSSPLKGTRYSDAIKAFNDERTNIKQWSVEELGKLLDICVQHKSDLETGGGADPGGRTLIDRITQLRDIVPRILTCSSPITPEVEPFAEKAWIHRFFDQDHSDTRSPRCPAESISKVRSRANPACIIFLLDQSYSMNNGIAGSRRPKIDALATGDQPVPRRPHHSLREGGGEATELLRRRRDRLHDRPERSAQPDRRVGPGRSGRNARGPRPRQRERPVRRPAGDRRDGRRWWTTGRAG